MEKPQESKDPTAVNRKAIGNAVDTWDVSTTNGLEFRRIPAAMVVRGIKEGWLCFDDRVRSKRFMTPRGGGLITLTGATKDNPWQPAREAFGRVFEVERLINPSRAFARYWGKIGAAVAPAVALTVWWFLLGIGPLSLRPGGALLFTASMLLLHFVLFVTFLTVYRTGGFAALAMSLAFVPIGVLLLPFFAAQFPGKMEIALVASFGLPMLPLMLMLGKLGQRLGGVLLVVFFVGTVVLDLSGARPVVLSLDYPVEMGLVLVLGAMFGLGLGCLAGWRHGIRHATRYKLPVQRQPVPDYAQRFVVSVNPSTRGRA